MLLLRVVPVHSKSYIHSAGKRGMHMRWQPTHVIRPDLQHFVPAADTHDANWRSPSHAREKKRLSCSHWHRFQFNTSHNNDNKMRKIRSDHRRSTTQHDGTTLTQKTNHHFVSHAAGLFFTYFYSLRHAKVIIRIQLVVKWGSQHRIYMYDATECNTIYTINLNIHPVLTSFGQFSDFTTQVLATA